MTSALLGVVCVFELPLVVLTLVHLGVLASSTLRRNRRKGNSLAERRAAKLSLAGAPGMTGRARRS